MARPRGEPAQAFTIRFPVRLLRKIDRFIRDFQKANPSLQLCRADAIRMLVDRGADLGPKPVFMTGERMTAPQLQALVDAPPSPHVREFSNDDVDRWLATDKFPTRKTTR